MRSSGNAFARKSSEPQAQNVWRGWKKRRHDVPRAMACDGIIPRASAQHAWVQVAYSLLAVSPDRHLEYIRCMTGSEPLANGTGLRLSDWMLGP